ncbi:MAG: peptidyl-prolyl cis-trans isomerase [Planctomycetes bacterium]|nr:peptidyl-prolyl cis-trans isomerase [Planctomycetota bacterium]
MIATLVGIAAGFAVLFALLGFTQPAAGEAAAPAEPETKETAPVIVRLETSKGNIDIELNQEKAPISVENFLKYVDDGFYNDTIFHRVIPNFMIQGGGFTEDMNQKPTRPGIKNEWRNGLSNTRGTIAMARLGRQPDSATAQFFINVADNAFLDEPRDGAGYAVFGKVTAESMEVVDAIRQVRTGNRGPHGDVPVEPVVIKKASRLTEKEDD